MVHLNVYERQNTWRNIGYFKGWFGKNELLLGVKRKALTHWRWTTTDGQRKGKMKLKTKERKQKRERLSREKIGRYFYLTRTNKKKNIGGPGRSEKQYFSTRSKEFTSPIRFSSCAASGSFFAIACYVSDACDVAGRFYDWEWCDIGCR